MAGDPRIRGEHAGRGRRRPSRGRIIPAYAGSIERTSGRWTCTRDHPRIRGEHSIVVTTHRFPRGSSPHTRGALPVSQSPAGRVADHPRIRGEHADIIIFRSIAAGSSPHTRGALFRFLDADFHRGIIPAYAGSTPASRRTSVRWRDHPRIRGEHGQGREEVLFALGSSPHTRGARLRRQCCHPGVGIIPAYAGSTRAACGVSFPGSGSSPHTRGALEFSLEPVPGCRIIPAYAGSTPPTRSAP